MRFVLLTFALLAADPYRQEMENWRERREASLKSSDGWLTLAGLFWLKEGANTAGSEAGSSIVLPKGPAKYGVFERAGSKVTFRGADGSTREMLADTSGRPATLVEGDLSMTLIDRNGRLGIRLKDRNAATLKEFKGLQWFPVNGKYRIKAKFVPYNPPRQIVVPNVLGDATPTPCPGYVAFTLDGREHKLEPVGGGGSLFFIFKDETSGKETYPPGRFLYTGGPEDGTVVLDFNKAENPPCAFTPYATCPLPPKENRLSVRIEAGEKRPPGH